MTWRSGTEGGVDPEIEEFLLLGTTAQGIAMGSQVVVNASWIHMDSLEH